MQVEHVCKKARRQIGFLYRRFYQHANGATFLQLYLSYVRPHLEYASAVWDPHQQGLVIALENVQKFALRAVTKDWKAGYDHLVSTCNLPTLQQRRRLLKLCALYQMINGHLVLPDAPIQIRSINRELRNTSQYWLQQPPARTNAHLFSFFPHAIALWNELPSTIHNCNTLLTFKKRVCEGHQYLH